MKGLFFFLMIFFLVADLYSFSSGPMRNLLAVEYAALAVAASDHYRIGNRETAKEYLQRILEKNRSDTYANQFLGTLFLMDGNLEACLKYWNRVGQPVIEQIQLQPAPVVNPELMDKAFVMSPSSPLTYEDYLATESRLEMTGIFNKQEFQLKPHAEQGKFDLIVKSSVKKSPFSSRIKIATLLARAALTETVRLDFPNIGGTTISSSSLVSWDEFKNRFYSSLSLPFNNRPHLRFRIFTDTRKETWALADDVNLLKWEGGLELGESVNSKWQWTSGAKLSYRHYDNISNTFGSELQEGWLIQAFGNLNYSLIRIPERRFSLESNSSTEIGRLVESSGNLFLTLENSLEMRWFPQPVGEDYAVTGRFRTGKMVGAGPFDEYFVLGVERDTDLLLRAHKTRTDKKGENPFAPAYALWNLDITKIMINKKAYRLRFTPFVDVGRIFDSRMWQGERWFLDTGIQAGLQLLGGPELVFTFGKDLRTGRNVMYLAARL